MDIRRKHTKPWYTDTHLAKPSLKVEDPAKHVVSRHFIYADHVHERYEESRFQKFPEPGFYTILINQLG